MAVGAPDNDPLVTGQNNIVAKLACERVRRQTGRTADRQTLDYAVLLAESAYSRLAAESTWDPRTEQVDLAKLAAVEYVTAELQGAPADTTPSWHHARLVWQRTCAREKHKADILAEKAAEEAESSS